MAKLYYYENEENYQHGHGKLLKEGDIDALLSPAKAWHYNREEKLCIVSHDTEGYIGELSFDVTNGCRTGNRFRMITSSKSKDVLTSL